LKKHIKRRADILDLEAIVLDQEADDVSVAEEEE